MKTRLYIVILTSILSYSTFAYAEAESPESETELPQTEQNTSSETTDASEVDQTTNETEQDDNDAEDTEKKASVKLHIKGIEDEDLLKNVELYLGQLDKEEADGSERYQYLVKQNADKALRALGYYRSQLQILPSDNGKEMTLYVTLQKPVKLNEREVVIEGEAKKDPDFINLVKKTVPKKGTILNHGTYEGFKSDVERLSQTKGYFDSEWLYHRLEVYPTEYIADWRLGYETGERYHYGNISFNNSQIDQSYLDNILEIKTGEPYLTYDLSELTADLSSSKWFSTVLIEPTIVEESKTVDLAIQLVPRKKNKIEIGIGYETDVGPHLRLGWDKPWINKYGHNIESDLYVSAPEQTFDFAYNIPVKSNPLDYYYQFAAGYEHEDNNDTKYTAATMAFQRFWNHDTGWSYSAGLKARYDDFIQGDDNYKTILVYPTASVTHKRTDGNLFPVWGEKQTLTVNYGNKIWGSDVNFYSIKATAAMIRTYYTNHRFYLRGEVGYLHSSEFERIPSALRYFAGGDSSIRGFAYKDISPKDSDGDLTGGTNLATATFEYQYQVYPSWWAAVFYDTGLAANNFKTSNLHSGVGVGVRWASPIGAIKFDLATPVSDPDDNSNGVQYYIGIGSEL